MKLMKKRPPLKLSFDYMGTPERRVLSLEGDGILCMPVLGFDCYRRQWEQPPLHVHEMREHPERDYPLDKISESFGFSTSNLLVRFKRLTGLPPHAFLLER